MVREFQSVIGQEARAQILAAAGRLPDVVVACVGGGSNAMGIFDAFVADESVRLVGVEAGGRGTHPGDHAARFAGGARRRAARHAQSGAAGRRRQHPADAFGLGRPRLSVDRTRARVAGGRRPHRVRAGSTTTTRSKGFEWLARTEGILPALESSHAVAWVRQTAAALQPRADRAGESLGSRRQGRRDRAADPRRRSAA